MVPLHMAAARGRYEVVGYLVGKGAKNDIKDKKGVGICDPIALYDDLGYINHILVTSVAFLLCA